MLLRLRPSEGITITAKDMPGSVYVFVNDAGGIQIEDKRNSKMQTQNFACDLNLNEFSPTDQAWFTNARAISPTLAAAFLHHSENGVVAGVTTKEISNTAGYPIGESKGNLDRFYKELGKLEYAGLVYVRRDANSCNTYYLLDQKPKTATRKNKQEPSKTEIKKELERRLYRRNAHTNWWFNGPGLPSNPRKCTAEAKALGEVLDFLSNESGIVEGIGVNDLIILTGLNTRSIKTAREDLVSAGYLHTEAPFAKTAIKYYLGLPPNSST